MITAEGGLHYKCPPRKDYNDTLDNNGRGQYRPNKGRRSADMANL